MPGARHRVAAQVEAVISVQVADPDRVDLVEADVTLQGAERPAAEVDQQPEALGLHQVAGGRAVRPREAARASDDGKPHDPPGYAHRGAAISSPEREDPGHEGEARWRTRGPIRRGRYPVPWPSRPPEYGAAGSPAWAWPAWACGWPPTRRCRSSCPP